MALPPAPPGLREAGAVYPRVCPGRTVMHSARGPFLREYKNNTLVIDYAKPPEILQQEAKDREERTKMKSEDRPGDECKTQ